MNDPLQTRMKYALTCALVSSGWALSAHAAHAQSPRNSAFIADSMAAAGDSAGAFDMLESTLRRDSRNAAAWHQLGLISWSMARSARKPQFIRDARVVRWLTVADSALRLATQLAPDSARYWLSLGRFNLTSGVSTQRFAAAGQAQHALDAATKTGDSLLFAAAADEVGMAVWRRYEPVAHRATTNAGVGVDLFAIQRNHAADYLRSVVQKIEPPTGNADYTNAFEHFRWAERADRTSQRYSRHLFMALGERGRWNEMRSLARERVTQYPIDYQAWMAIGLASHRLADETAATVAFDSAAVLMDDAERDRMSSLTRILRPRPVKNRNGKDVQAAAGDAQSFLKLNEGARRGLEAMFWMMSDPLALTNENEYRLEFLSRVVYADFRFTNEDLGVRGADTDRGDIYVRYGPPKQEVTIGASGNQSLQFTTLAWIYGDDLVFFFDLIPGFATARTLFSDRDYVELVKSAIPVKWDNVPTTRLLDTIPIRIARFRATADSIDAVVSALVPVDSLVRGLPMVRVPVDIDFRLYDQFVRVRGVESAQSGIAPDSAVQPLARTWTRRLGPGINVVRVEALQLDSKRAARAMSRVDPERTTGFGMSDVLLGGKPALRNNGRPAERWTDVAIEPSAGTFAAGSAIGLLWEMYEIAAINGQAKYRLAVTVDRVDRLGAAGFAARLVDGVGRTLGRQQSGRSHLTIAFDRAVAGMPTLVEFVSLDLSEAAAGAYRLRVDVTDLTNQRKTSRQTEFRIR